MRHSARAEAAAGAVLAAGLAILARAVWFEPRRLVVRERTLTLPRWPAALDGLRVALISDLHAGAPQVDVNAVRRVVRRANRRAPDLVAVLGDFVDPRNAGADPVAPEAVARALGGLRAPLGTIAVLGNHDWANDGPRVARALTTAGIVVLENGSVAREHGGATLHVAGLADAGLREPDVAAALSGVPDGEPVLLLSHDPDVFPSVPERVALTVAGHTHGGQVNLPFLRGRMIPSRFGDRYARGHVVEGGRHLFVTSGIGTSRWPVRLRRPPELVVLALRAA